MLGVTKDPAIKLFGKTIQLQDEVFNLNDLSFSPKTSAGENKYKFEEQQLNKNPCGEKVTDAKEARLMKSEEFTNQNPTLEMDDNPQTPSFDNEAGTGKSSNNEEEQSGDSSNSQEKTLKKPDKLIPCPRCNSMDTKFCYYNNYNVNQPRHFCKNCQRYWTAGGTMRNVPVGAGRRKNKNPISQYPHVNVSEVLQRNGTVLTFGPETPLWDSKANELRLKMDGHNNKDDAGGIGLPNSQNYSPQLPSFPGAPWSYPCFPMPIYPSSPYWGCTVPNPWNVQWIAPTTPTSGPNYPTLGKHSRDDDNLEKSLWFPKTLRIADPCDAERSSLLATLGIKNDKADSIPRGWLFKIFQSKGSEKIHVSENSSVLHANPAALSRSVSFYESS